MTLETNQETIRAFIFRDKRYLMPIQIKKSQYIRILTSLPILR